MLYSNIPSSTMKPNKERQMPSPGFSSFIDCLRLEQRYRSTEILTRPPHHHHHHGAQQQKKRHMHFLGFSSHSDCLEIGEMQIYRNCMPNSEEAVPRSKEKQHHQPFHKIGITSVTQFTEQCGPNRA
ncbi:hypothetical protein HNY73_010099 [Argiope bruennichi]|uniref:Uncharacterized protein n=1 Tax=Argiope bruennichi TaxID=94029 RepID=A0A8T0F4S1_ARGBR|nr:hypothetical protein HNY73_010099 [Argiope bruennichi]